MEKTANTDDMRNAPLDELAQFIMSQRADPRGEVAKVIYSARITEEANAALVAETRRGNEALAEETRKLVHRTGWLVVATWALAIVSVIAVLAASG